MLYSVVSFEDFCRLFDVHKRSSQFTYSGLLTLFYHLDDAYEDEMHQVDVIGLCCEWSEYRSAQELLDDYCSEYSSPELHDEGMKLLRSEYTILDLKKGEGFLIREPV